MHPVRPCRMRWGFDPRMRINRFVFLDLSTLSLEDHLGVTVSPQSPLSAGYITPSAGEGSLPPGLMPAAARAAPFPRCFRLPYSSPFCCDMGNGYFNRALDPLQHNGLRAHPSDSPLFQYFHRRYRRAPISTSFDPSGWATTTRPSPSSFASFNFGNFSRSRAPITM